MDATNIVEIFERDIPDEIYYETSNRVGYYFRKTDMRRGFNAKLEKVEKLTVRLRLDKLDFKLYKGLSNTLALKNKTGNIAYIQYGRDKRTDRYEIYNIFVESDYRRNGYGKKLLETALKNIPPENITVARVRSDNIEALEFFENNGFEITGYDLYAYSKDGLERQSIELILARL